MTNTSGEVEIYLHKSLPTSDSVTTGPMRAAATLDQDGHFELVAAAATRGEQVTALCNLLTGLLAGVAEHINRPPSDVAVLAAYDVLTRPHFPEDSDDE